MDLLRMPRHYAICLLLIFSFVLGYVSHHYSNPKISLTPPADKVSDGHNIFTGQCKAGIQPEQVRQTIIDRVFNGTSPWDGFPPAYAKPLLVKKWIKGWGSNHAVFENLFRQVRPKTVIEVGTFLGASALHMAGLAAKLDLDTQILCIDDFRGWPGFTHKRKSLKMVNGDTMLMYQFMQNVVQANATDAIMFLPFSTTTALAELCRWGVYGDLVEIDADHDFHSAWVDINHGFKMVRQPGGVLFGHDYAWEGVRRAVHMFAELHDLRVRLDGKHWILY